MTWFIRDTDIYIAKSKSRSIERLFSYTRKYRFPLCYPFRTKSLAPTQLFAKYFSQKAWFLRKGRFIFRFSFSLRTSSYPTVNGLIRYFRQKAWFLPKDKLFPLMLSLPNKKFRLNSTFRKVFFTKSVVFVKRWIYFPLFLFSPHLVLPYGKRTHKVLSAKSVATFRKGHRNFIA